MNLGIIPSRKELQRVTERERFLKAERRVGKGSHKWGKEKKKRSSTFFCGTIES